ncbi:MAG: enoyl-CoA hydratase-related protein [Paracoccaceae bacterium]
MDAPTDTADRTCPVRYRVIGPVGLLVMAQRPVNVLSGAMRRALSAGLDWAEAESRVKAVVLTGSAKLFSAGADIAELGQGGNDPGLADLCARTEGFDKPVIVALRGAVLGGGLELALAAHCRIADVQARMGFPEITLGLLPGAGGTQRLPRLIGAEQALRMMVQGKTVTATEGLAMGLLDQVVETRLLPTALRYAATVPAVRRTLQQASGLRDARAYLDAVSRARAAHLRNPVPAALRIVDMVETAQLLPTEQALAAEWHALGELLASPESLALRYLFRAERRAATPPVAVAAQRVPKLSRLGVWGASVDCADLVGRALSAGMQVTLADPSRERLVATLQRIAETAEAQVAAGHLAPAGRDAAWARLGSVQQAEGLVGADLIAVSPKAMELPDFLTAVPQIGLEGVARGGVALSVDPGKAGVVEIAFGRGASPAVLAIAVALARRLRGPMVFAGLGGPIALRLRETLEAALDLWRARGTPADQLQVLRGAFSANAPVPGPLADAGLAGKVRLTSAALANTGAWLLAERVARHPSDIDAVAVQAGVMPRWLGGPLHQADLRGLLLLRADLLEGVSHSADLFTPAPLIDTLVAEGARFGSLNG